MCKWAISFPLEAIVALGFLFLKQPRKELVSDGGTARANASCEHCLGLCSVELLPASYGINFNARCAVGQEAKTNLTSRILYAFHAVEIVVCSSRR